MKEEQAINGLPKGWEVVKLRELCTKISNGANAKQVDEKIGFPISRIETIWNEQIDINRVKYIHENDPAFVEKYALKKNDLLFSHINSDTHLGKTAIFKNQTNTLIHGINLLLIRFKEDVSADFLNYQFKYKRKKGEFISIAQKSVNQSSINQVKLKNLDFILPPLKEQKQIVSKIEELFSELDKGIEELKTAQQQLKVYRQAVLKSAFEGKSETFKLYKLSEVCDFVTKGTTPAKSDLFQNEGEVPFLKVYNLTFDGSLDFTKDPTFVTKETSTGFLRRSQVFPGDVLMNIVGPPLGKVSIVPSTYPEWNINQAIVRFRCKEGLLNKYLLHFLLSENTIRTYSRKAKATAGQFNLTLEICREIEIPIPSTEEEQQQIVHEIESRLSVCNKVEETITASLKQAEAIRQSILKKAFKGKLSYQN